MELGARGPWFATDMLQLELFENLSSLRFAVIRNNSEMRCPSLHFPDPIRDRRVRNDDKDRVNFPVFDNIANERR